MGQSNPELKVALVRLSSTKYGRPRAEVEREIFARLGSGDAARKAKMEALKEAQQQRMRAMSAGGGSGIPPAPHGTPLGMPTQQAPSASFLDEWLAKRQQLSSAAPQPVAAPNPAFGPTTGPTPVAQPLVTPQPAPTPTEPRTEQSSAAVNPDRLHIREDHKNTHHEVSLKLRDED